MKIANQASPLIVSSDIESGCSLMGMTQEAALRMTHHLRDTVYSNKILAVVRELSSNIFDEHKKYDVEKPAFIGVRKEGDEYEFFARDYAKGLSESDVRNVFGMYGASTKSLTNNLLGTYGIGSKVFFAISSIFSVVSHFEGIKTIYSCAIGGDENGSSNGFIYKIHEEPTNESGLEVSGPIKSSDLSKFSNEINKFVQLSPHGIVADILGTKVVPAEVCFSKTIDGITVKSLKDARTLHNNNALAALQMGGVSYETIPLPEGFKALEGQALVVDLPIGSMTVALSRESFHDTPSNQNCLLKVSKILQDLANEDFADLKAKPLKDFIDENLGELHVNRQVEGKIFKTRISYVYPETSKLIGNLAYVDHGTVVQKNNKPLLILIPDTKATDYWKSKLRDFARANGESYYIACHNEFLKLSQEGVVEINKYFHPLGIKSLKFPKTKKVKAYAVYQKKHREGSFNAIGFANHLRVNSFNLPEETDEQKLKEWIASEKQKAIATKDSTKLNKLAITVGSPSRYTSWSCTSEELAQHIEDLGLFVTGRGEYSKHVQQWAQEQATAQEKQNKIKKALKSWATFHPRTIELVKKDKNAERLNKFWEAIMAEKTTRTKIFSHVQSSYENYYGNKNKLTRTELRAILKLQNA